MDPVVIVGGGTAGCIVARTLADLTGVPLVLVEPGPRTDDDAPRFMDGLSDAVMWPGLDYPQARALGGGSAVNGMILSGEEPGWLKGLTRQARPEEAGPLGTALLRSGGRLSRLWWNNGRWNPARAVLHLEEEGRMEIVRGTVGELVVDGARVPEVVVDGRAVRCSHVVLCCGAVLTPLLLRASGVRGSTGEGLQNHPTVTFTVDRPEGVAGRFDATTVLDIDSDGAVGLAVGFERAHAGDSGHGLVTVSLMNPRSRGAVADRVEFALLDDPWDAAAMERLTGTAEKVLARAGLTVREVSDPHPVSHPTSSCASVVDGRGMLHSLTNVTVADASVLPGVPPETPAASVTISALRIARLLGEELA
ncbi:MAG: hypothetical protein RLZZ305_795 [Actinomycetota bacterium]|jgi:choline dehydrogenase-like flavoprotein